MVRNNPQWFTWSKWLIVEILHGTEGTYNKIKTYFPKLKDGLNTEIHPSTIPKGRCRFFAKIFNLKDIKHILSAVSKRERLKKIQKVTWNPFFENSRKKVRRTGVTAARTVTEDVHVWGARVETRPFWTQREAMAKDHNKPTAAKMSSRSNGYLRINENSLRQIRGIWDINKKARLML